MNNLAQKEFYTIVAGSAILAANAGFINVVTLAGAFSVTVSHVTGNVSRIAMAVAQGDLTSFSLVLSILFSFMFGAFVAGYLVGDARFQLGRAYGYALLLEAGMLFLSFATLKRELVLGEWCAAFACGLQNALATSYSGAVVRTTHMTGIATDIGNILGQACRIDSAAETWRLKVHVPIMLGFIGGGLLGTWAYAGLREHALLLPCIFTGAAAAAYLSLPFVRAAAAAVRAQQLHAPAAKLLDLRVVGDPRHAADAARLPRASVHAAVDVHLARISGKPSAASAGAATLNQRRTQATGSSEDALGLKTFAAHDLDATDAVASAPLEAGDLSRPAFTTDPFADPADGRDDGPSAIVVAAESNEEILVASASPSPSRSVGGH